MTSDQGERTEKATPKKREDARKKGQVLKSAEVNTAVMTLTMFAALYIFGGGIVEDISAFLVSTLNNTDFTADLDINGMHRIVIDAFTQIILILLPLLIIAFVIGIVVNIAQVGFLFTGEPLMPKFSKINPLQGFKRIFSLRSLVEMFKSILKITVIAWVVYNEYMSNFQAFPEMTALTIPQAAGHIVEIAVGMAFKAILALVAIGLADYLYQWWEYERNLKMTKQEIKQEYKQQEGDPLIKSKRREKQRQMSMMRMMQDLPRADVVITNPTHYAIALRYKEEEAAAPVVLAKGKDYTAQKIKEKARELKIEIVENKPLAQALFVACDIGDKIPQDMFAAVAEILAQIYKTRSK